MLRVGITYPRILFGLILTDFFLTLIVPSGIARIVIMAAIALGLVEAFRVQTGSNVARGMFLLFIYSLGLGIPFVITGFGINAFLQLFSRYKRFVRAGEILSGILLLLRRECRKQI